MSSVTAFLSLRDLQAWHKAAQWLLPELVRSCIIRFCTTWHFSVDLKQSLPDTTQVSRSILSDLFCCHYQHSWGSWDHQQLFAVTTVSCETTEISWWLLSCHAWTSKLCYKTCLLERQRQSNLSSNSSPMLKFALQQYGLCSAEKQIIDTNLHSEHHSAWLAVPAL